MQQIINFILRYRTFLLYLLLFGISLALTVRSHSYHHSKFFNSANWLSGSVYQTKTNIKSYFELDEEIRELREENARLRRLLINNEIPDTLELDTINISYSLVPARIIKNSYSSPNNYITINKGEEHGLAQDMGVISSRGILGIIESTSANYSAVQSILNSRSNINAKIANTNYFGTLTWNGRDYSVVQLEDIPRLVPLLVGDTIVTGAMSSIFPENIPIGTIKKFNLDNSASFYNIEVDLFNDMTNLYNVYVISDRDRDEKIELEASVSDGQ